MVGSFYCFSDLITMVLRSYISIEISARTDATSVRCRSRMWQQQSHLTEANALVLYFCTSIQKDISCPMSSTPPRVARSFLERTMKWYLRRDLYTVYTCENCTKGSNPCTFFFCDKCYNAKLSEQDDDSGKKRKDSSRTNRAKPRRFVF